MIWGKERQMEVGPGFFWPSAISTQRLLLFCRFSKSKLKEVLTTGSVCIWGNFLAVIRWGQLLGDPSLHWEVEKCFYMYDPTPTLHLTFDYGNYLRWEQGELIETTKIPSWVFQLCLWKGEVTEICVATPTVDLKRSFQSLEAHDHF